MLLALPRGRPKHAPDQAFIIDPYGKRKQQGHVLGMTQNFSTRMVAKGFLCAAVAVSVLLWSLLLVGTAGADPVQQQAGEAVSPIESVQPTTGQVGEGASSETTTPSESGTEPGQEAAGEPGAEQGSGGGEATAPEQPSPPAGETTPETVTEPETVVEPVEPETVVETVKETVAEPVLEHVSETVVPVEPVVEHAKEVVTPVIEPVKEQANELLSSAEPTKELVAAVGVSSASGPGTQTGGGATVASAPATEASGALVASLVAPSTGGGPGEPPTASTAPASISGVPTHLTAAQRAGELSCQLSGLGGAATDNCSASWLSSEPLLVSAPGALVPGALVLAARARAGTPAGSSQGGSGGGFGGSHSFLPPPGPAPTGAVGGSAAGGSGVGLSGFFTLAGLLLLAGPRALRRLRLSSQPWLTAFFVLIPERPG
jgi:hypothetical protein